jgi:CubicO group peptidase (beta-lactamase class C family)
VRRDHRERLRGALAGLLGLVLLATGCSADSPAPTDDGTQASGPSGSPADGVATPWPTTNPAAAGFDPQVLTALAREARREASTCFVVVRDGRLVADWSWQGTDPDDPREVFSVTKSVTSALVGIALRDGLLDLDDRAARWIPSWRGTRSRAVTIRQLLTNTSGRLWSTDSDYRDLVGTDDRTGYAVGLRQQYAPGTAWAYNNAAIQTLDRVLSEATGMPTAQYAEERLFGPLGMADSTLTKDSSGESTNLFFGLQTTCLDLARFGRLYLDGGVVDGRRILSRSYVEASTGRSGSALNAAYGFLWWLNRPGLLRGPVDPVDASGQPLAPRSGQLAPGAPEDVFSAQGLGGQTVLVDPGSDTVVVRLGLLPDRPDRAYTTADAARVVTEALRRP